MKLKNNVLASYSIGGGIASSFAYNMMMVYILVFSTDVMGISGRDCRSDNVNFKINRYIYRSTNGSDCRQNCYKMGEI